MVLFAPWQLNVLFYVWLAAAVLRTQSKIKSAEQAAIRFRDENEAELNAYRVERTEKAMWKSRAEKAMRNSRAERASKFMSADKYMQHQQDQKDKHTQHQQHMQDKQDKLDKLDKQDKLDKIAQRKSTEQVTAERKFVTRKNILFK